MKTDTQTPASDGVPRYYWKQCYEIGDSVHWALCDTESDKEKPQRVSCAYMVLHADYPTAIGGRPVSEEPMLVRIVNALNNDATLARLNGELHVLLTQARADRDREAAKVDKLDAENAGLKATNSAMAKALVEMERLATAELWNTGVMKPEFGKALQQARDVLRLVRIAS